MYGLGELIDNLQYKVKLTQVVLSTARTSAEAMDQNSCTIGLDTSPSSLSSPPLADAWWETSVWDVCSTVSSTTKKLWKRNREIDGREMCYHSELKSEASRPPGSPSFYKMLAHPTIPKKNRLKSLMSPLCGLRYYTLYLNTSNSTQIDVALPMFPEAWWPDALAFSSGYDSA